MVRKLNLVLLEKQTELDVPCSSLGSNDFYDVMEAMQHDTDPTIEEDNRGGAGFQNNPRTVGKYETTGLQLVSSLYSMGGSNSEPDIVRALECAGFERRLNEGYIVMVPRNDIVDACSIWAYDGGPGTNKAMLFKYGNVMFDWTIAIETGKRAMLTLDGTGKIIDLPSIATMPTVEAQRERQIAPAFMQGLFTLNGASYKPIRFEIKGNQSLFNWPDVTDTYGGGETEITERAIGWTATVIKKPDLAITPYTNIKNQTIGDLDVRWGRVHNYPDLRLYSSKCYVQSAKNSEESGVETYDLEGYIRDNDMEFRIWNGNSSSYSSTSASISSDSNSSSSSSASTSSTSSSSASSQSL